MITVECNLQGEHFHPSRLFGQTSANVPMRLINEPGQIGTTGRYKGVPIPYGACRIVTPDNVDPSDRIEWMTDFLSRHISTFRINGATDIVLHLDWTGVQGNMEFSAAQLKKFAELDIPLNVTYRYIEQ